MRETNGARAISIRRLGKRYHIGAPRRTLYERVGRIARTAGAAAQAHPTIWALRDVSLDVEPGIVLGVLGRNGSGKSTLMKILSRITFPTEGRAETWGRVGALLEVGTGFHPELSGRDNIALAGAILGMSRREVAAREEEIVDFAGIAPFLDTPVKHYSSGMYLRLAFSVSSHLRAEIMLVDEILSVGDAEFQARSLQRIRAIVREGRTVLFVSHAMESIRSLCDRAIVLDNGELRFDGPADQAVDHYLGQIVAA